MATEFKLSYTGAEINSKLGRIPDEEIATVSDVLARANQNSSDESYSPIADTDLVTKEYVDSNVLTSDEDVLNMLMELDVVTPITNSNNEVYTSNDGKIYSL